LGIETSIILRKSIGYTSKNCRQLGVILLAQSRFLLSQDGLL